MSTAPLTVKAPHGTYHPEFLIKTAETHPASTPEISLEGSSFNSDPEKAARSALKNFALGFLDQLEGTPRLGGAGLRAHAFTVLNRRTADTPSEFAPVSMARVAFRTGKEPSAKRDSDKTKEPTLSLSSTKESTGHLPKSLPRDVMLSFPKNKKFSDCFFEKMKYSDHGPGMMLHNRRFLLFIPQALSGKTYSEREVSNAIRKALAPKGHPIFNHLGRKQITDAAKSCAIRVFFRGESPSAKIRLEKTEEPTLSFPSVRELTACLNTSFWLGGGRYETTNVIQALAGMFADETFSVKEATAITHRIAHDRFKHWGIKYSPSAVLDMTVRQCASRSGDPKELIFFFPREREFSACFSKALRESDRGDGLLKESLRRGAPLFDRSPSSIRGYSEKEISDKIRDDLASEGFSIIENKTRKVVIEAAKSCATRVFFRGTSLPSRLGEKIAYRKQTFLDRFDE